MSISKLSMLCLSIALTTLVFGQEKKLTRSDLPQAVQQAADRETKGATIKGFAREKENGKTVFEVETVVNGHTRDLQFAQDGTLNEVEEETAFSVLSGEVRRSLEAQAQGAKIVKVESLTKKGILIAYEAAIIRNGKNGEIQVGPNGKKLAHEE